MATFSTLVKAESPSFLEWGEDTHANSGWERENGDAVQPLTWIAFQFETPLPKKTCFSANQKLHTSKTVDLPIEYPLARFEMEPGVHVYCTRPLKLRPKADGSILEVQGWGVEVPLKGDAQLPSLIARRFFELFSQAQVGALDDMQAAQFAEICSGIDYHRYMAELRMPLWQEAWLRQKNPCKLDFGYGSARELSSEVSQSLSLLREGDYFGGWYTTDREGNILKICHPQLRPGPESFDELEWPTPSPLELDLSMENLLPPMPSAALQNGTQD